MPITNHTLAQSVQANGSTHNVLRMYDQDAREYIISFFAPADFDVGALVQNRIAEQDVQLAEMEFEQLVGAE
jgi:hypothetical protein